MSVTLITAVIIVWFMDTDKLRSTDYDGLLLQQYFSYIMAVNFLVIASGLFSMLIRAIVSCDRMIIRVTFIYSAKNPSPLKLLV
jgi:hypothetical protein